MLRISQSFAKFYGIVQVGFIGRCTIACKQGELAVKILDGFGEVMLLFGPWW